jgi:hypothetical protein
MERRNHSFGTVIDLSESRELPGSYPAASRREQNEGVDYGTQQAICPRCGSGAQVRTVAELFDMLNGMQGQAMQRAQQGQQGQQQAPYGDGSGQGYVFAGEGYSDYGPSGTRTSRPADFDNPLFDDSGGGIEGDIANVVMGTAFKFVGRAIGKRVQKTIQERVVPAMQARAAQAQQQWQQSRADQAAIVQKYPDLRGCMHDQVVFLQGGTRAVPISEIRMPVTLAQADALVNRLSAP